ncbi:MAG: CoA transferase [Xanthobacteraceae bacterium]|nr:CoA transferase [Xanthobacteraceae bacterium]QYK46382.1 MAG: CoA transferase [Xanthobacteraceae bacterium]
MQNKQPLSGIVVADFTTLLPGPVATLMLAEAGAEVIKVEKPGGEDMRAYPPQWDGISAAFAMLNRGKKSLICDLRSEDGRKAARELAARADVLVEQFRPGVMAKHGLGYEDLRKINPKLVYCSITGYGQTGPRSGEAGHDLNYISATGLLSLAPGPKETPVVPPALVADIGGGTFPAVINILLALIAREKTGQGAHLDIAMADAMFTFAWMGLATLHGTGKAAGPGSLIIAGGSPRYQIYPTRDGKFVACGALEQKFWMAFCAVIGLPQDLVNDFKNPQATKDAVRAIVARETADYWRPKLAAADCCVTIVATLEEALADEHFVKRGLFTETVAGATAGKSIPALPVPIAPAFRARGTNASYPKIK